MPNTQPLEQNRDLVSRCISIRAATLNEDDRTVDIVIATEGRVEVYDWAADRIVEEVLRIDAGEFPAQIPLLANHSRWSLEDILGSARNFRDETLADGTRAKIGTATVMRDNPKAERAWSAIRQGHLTDFSVGYRVHDAEEVRAGEKRTIAGQEYAADRRTLRVATRWTAKEVSAVPIGADPRAKARSASEIQTIQGEPQMATERTDPTPAPVPPPPEVTRTDPDPVPPPPDPVTQERARVRKIHELAGQDIPAATVREAVEQGWSVDEASNKFLQVLRSQRMLTEGKAPAGHFHEPQINARTLAAAMLASRGADPTKCRIHDGRRDPGRKALISEQEADAGDEFRAMPMLDIVRECARIDSGRFIRDPEEAWRTAVSGTSLALVFTTNVYARLIEGWNTVADSTTGWCDEEDVPNFLTQEDISLQAQAAMRQLPRGATATHATASDSHETYKIARYAKQFVIDDQDRIDDRLGALNRMPMEMGEAARYLRPDLVYSVILENPTLVADSGAVFNATAVTTAGGHANLASGGSSALDSTSLKAGVSAMVKQRIIDPTDRTKPGRQINNRPRYLIVPSDLEWQARGLTSSEMLLKLFADSSDPNYFPVNLLQREGLQVVIDDRIGAAGVIDPRTQAARTGSATNWFLTSGGRRGLRVAYRAGTGRAPQLRSFVLDKGQWGLGWDINLDIGAAFMDYIPWYKSVGA